METKYITIPFDLERAKRIADGKEDGKIVTCDGRNVRIVCFDVKNEDSILALVESKRSGVEFALPYQSTGEYFQMEQNDNDLMLSVPERTAFKDGDIVSFGIDGISIIKELDYNSHSSYFTLIGDSGYFNNRYWINDNMRKASEDEKNVVFVKVEE